MYILPNYIPVHCEDALYGVFLKIYKMLHTLLTYTKVIGSFLQRAYMCEKVLLECFLPF